MPPAPVNGFGESRQGRQHPRRWRRSGKRQSMRLFGAIVTNNGALSLNVPSDARRPWRDRTFFAMVDGPASLIVLVRTAVLYVRRAETSPEIQRGIAGFR